MDTPTDAPQVETAAASTVPATVSPAPTGSAAETLSTGSSYQDADAEFKAFYDAKNNPQATVPADETTGATQEQPAPVEGETAAASPAGEQPTEQAQAAVEPPQELPEQLRPRLHKPKDIAIALIAKERNVDLDEASDIYRAQTRPATIPGMEAQAPAAEPTTSQRLQVQVDELVAQLAKDRENSDQLSDESLDRRDRLADLRSDLKLAKFQEDAQTKARQQNEAQARDASLSATIQAREAEVRKAYPALNDPKSPLFVAAQAVVREMEANPQDAAKLDGPDAVDIVLARALMRAPQYATAPAPPVPKAPAAAPVIAIPPQPAAVRKPVPAAPGSQASAASQVTPTVGEAVANANTPAEIDALFDDFYKGDRAPRNRSSLLGRR